jgi:hypothetical protein
MLWRAMSSWLGVLTPRVMNPVHQIECEPSALGVRSRFGQLSNGVLKVNLSWDLKGNKGTIWRPPWRVESLFGCYWGVLPQLNASFLFSYKLGKLLPIYLDSSVLSLWKSTPSLILGRLPFKYASLAYLSIPSSSSFLPFCACSYNFVALAFKLSTMAILAQQASISTSLHLVQIESCSIEDADAWESFKHWSHF